MPRKRSEKKIKWSTEYKCPVDSNFREVDVKKYEFIDPTYHEVPIFFND